MTLDHVLDAPGQQTLREKAAEALREGRITLDEYHYLLRKELGYGQPAARDEPRGEAHHKRRRQLLAKALATLIFLAFVTGLLWAATKPGGLTSLVTLELPKSPAALAGTTYNATTTVALDAANITGLRASGSLDGGAADIYLDVAGQRYLVYHGDASAPAYAVTTEKESYALNENVLVTVVPATVSSTLWLTDSGGAKTSVQDGFIPAAPGEYVLDALINDSGAITKASTMFIVRDDTDAAKDIVRSGAPAALSFSDACAESCLIPATGTARLTLDIGTAPGATLTLSSVVAEEAGTNQPPVQAAALPDISVRQGESVTMDLSSYFTDPDGDALTFDFMNAPGAQMGVSNGVLTVTGVTPGSSQSVVYASDGSSIVQSNLFTITVTLAPSNTTPTENATGNATNVTNTTNGTSITNGTNLTAAGTNETAPPVPAGAAGNITPQNATFVAADCSNPDPNQRPLECIQGEGSTYFKPEVLLLENKQAVAVGLLTPVGNLLIKGGLVEHSTGQPNANDYQRGYLNENGDFVPTLWIDTQTGDLHLRGSLTEANGNIPYQEGYTVLTNRRGIILALIDRQTGDLIVRGNIVPYRRAFS